MDLLLLGGPHEGRIIKVPSDTDQCNPSDSDGARYCLMPGMTVGGYRVAFPESFSGAAKAEAIQHWQKISTSRGPET